MKLVSFMFFITYAYSHIVYLIGRKKVGKV